MDRGGLADDIGAVLRPELADSVLALARRGFVGNTRDFASWIGMYGELARQTSQPNPLPAGDQSPDPELMATLLAELARAEKIRDNGKGYGEYCLGPGESFDGGFQNHRLFYYTIGHIDYAPIQQIRSVTESFLEYVGAGESAIMDISIGVIEAAENAVKYGGGGLISVRTSLENARNFRIEITNPLEEVSVQDSIVTGKFHEGFTLMRGIMAMDKLFDHFEIDRDDERKEVCFTGEKKLELPAARLG